MFLLALCLAVAQTPLSEQVARIESDLAALKKSFLEELRAANHDDEKVAKANETFYAKQGKTAKELIALIKANPADPASVDGTLLLTGPMPWPFDDDVEVLQVALRNRDDERMGRLCFNVMYRGGELSAGPWATAISKAVAESNPNKEVRGQAVFSRGYLCRAAAFPYGRALSDRERDKLVAQARVFFNEVVEKYADVREPDGGRTIGEMAQGELKRLDNLPNLKIGGVAPEIEGRDLEGKPLKLGDYRGRVVVVVFWGSWCGPCMAMVPHERELWARHRGGPFTLLGVNCGDSIEKARKTAADNQMDWPSFHDGEDSRGGPTTTSYDVHKYPTVYVIDAKGVIRYFDARGKELEEAVETLLAELK